MIPHYAFKGSSKSNFYSNTPPQKKITIISYQQRGSVNTYMYIFIFTSNIKKKLYVSFIDNNANLKQVKRQKPFLEQEWCPLCTNLHSAWHCVTIKTHLLSVLVHRVPTCTQHDTGVTGVGTASDGCYDDRTMWQDVLLVVIHDGDFGGLFVRGDRKTLGKKK